MGKRKRGHKNKTSNSNPNKPPAKTQPQKSSEAPATTQPSLPMAGFVGASNFLPVLYANPNSQLPLSPKPPGPDLSHYPPTMPIEKIVSGILKNPPLMGVEAALEQLGLGPRISTALVEEVLKLSYGAGKEALKFFRLVAGWMLQGGRKHTPFAWNLLVDVLGKDKLFDLMWDCIKVMKSEGVLSMETFSSVFGSYASAKKISEATMTFEVMEQYGCPHDVIALNCLLSALCRYKETNQAEDFFNKVKDRIRPNADTYAVLLEGWERERNVGKARLTFGEMIIRVGWDPSNTSAYNAFLNTLINGYQAEEALKFLNVMKGRKCLPDLNFYSGAFHLLHQCKDTASAYGLWEIMRQSGITPDLPIYNTMIDVFCFANQFDCAYRLLDEMIFNGVFPNFKTYNTIFEALINARKVDEATSIFREMTKNEFNPLYANYGLAIKMYFAADDPEMAVTIWRHMIQKGVVPKADIASALIEGFCDLKRVSEARKYCEEAIRRGIQVPSETMRKLRDILLKEGKRDTYEQLEKKLRSISSQAKQ